MASSGVVIWPPMPSPAGACSTRAKNDPCTFDRSDTLRLSAAQRSFYAIAALVGVGGMVLGIWSILQALSADPEPTRIMLLTLLTLAAIACSRFPIKMGMRETFISLDSIPLVLAVVLLPVHDAVLIGIVTTIAALIGQPRHPGIAGWGFAVQTPLASGVAMGAAGALASLLIDGHETPGAVTIIPAFLIALALEIAFDACVFVELEAVHPGEGRHFLQAKVALAANVFLPALVTAVLTPYVDTAWLFGLLLPVLLASMYGALWIANSQQLEKRRGERLKDTFGRYVPEGIVDDNMDTMQQIELGGESHDVTVLFCDIRGFTSWSEDKGATEVITELNVLLTELSASVMSTGGTLDKFTGDGLMAFWGAPVPTTEHASRACRAALDMLTRLDTVNARRVEDGQHPFAIGIGVHSGSAVVGNVGHERRLDYTAIGDTVNTAARLEASTKDIGAVLLASRPTVDLVDEDLRERAMRIGEVTVKGKARPVEVWALQPLRPDVDDIDDTFAA